MTTEILKISNDALEIKKDEEQEKIKKAARVLASGGLVAFPTETVYGLGADATDESAAKKIYAAKGRPSDNPLIIHVAAPEDAEKYAYTNECYYRLARAFMPGPLTVILPKKDTIPLSVTGGLDTVAGRCPSHPTANAIIKASGTAIAAPSANISGSPSPTCAEHVIRDMTGRIDMIIDGGESEIGLESTIIKLEGSCAILLRPGAITPDALECVCERVTIAPSVTDELKENERPLSPGMKYRHYAPNAPLVLLDGNDREVLEFLRSAQESEKCTILCYDEEIVHLKKDYLIPVGKKDDLKKQAETLFAALRQANVHDTEIIYAHLPTKEGLGLALYNRMIRAAAHTIKKI